MSRNHSIKRVYAEIDVNRSSALEQGEHGELISPVQQVLSVFESSIGYLSEVPPGKQSFEDFIRTRQPHLVSFLRDAEPADMLGQSVEGSGLIRSPGFLNLAKRVKRDRNGSFDLVCVESNPGPSKSKMAKAMVVYNPPKKARKRKTRAGQNQNASSSLGGGGRSLAGSYSNAAGLGAGRSAGRVLGGSFVTAPAAEGFVVPRSHFGFAGQPQKAADYDSDRAVRVTGCGLFSVPVIAGSATPAAGFGGTATYWTAMTPSILDPRLSNIEKIFQFYAIRECRFTYVPAVGATTNVQAAFGVAQDVDIQFSITTPTQTQILELNTSILVPAWQVATMTYTHRGTKLWECLAQSAEVQEIKIQGAVGATLLGATASVTYGQFYVEYIVDFYEPGPVLPTDA